MKTVSQFWDWLDSNEDSQFWFFFNADRDTSPAALRAALDKHADYLIDAEDAAL